MSREPLPDASSPRTRLRRLLENTSAEVSARDGPSVLDRVQANFPPGSEIFINALPGDDPGPSLRLAAGLRQAGYEPVPHLAARRLSGPGALTEIVSRARGEAAVTRVLLIAGDMKRPAGPFSSSLDVLRTDILAIGGIRRIGFAGHPEEHAHASRAVLEEALAAKLTTAQAAGHEVEIVTQFCFDADAIRQWLKRLGAIGIEAPVRLGLAGPASVATLVRYAIRCGIGSSIRALQARPSAAALFMRDVSPDELLHDVLTPADASESRLIRNLHIFPFGGLAKTGEWLREALARNA